jgi:hypothetical protein
MELLAQSIPWFVAAGYSLVYVLAGCGVFGAIVISFAAKNAR